MTCPRILPHSSATSESAGTNPSDARIASTILASAVLPNAASVAAVIAARSSGSSGRTITRAIYVGGDNAKPIPPAKTSSPGRSSLRTHQSECRPTHSPAGRHELSPRGGKECSSRAGAATAAPADEPDERVELSGRVAPRSHGHGTRDDVRLPATRASPRRYAQTRMGRPPPHVHGKEGVDGSSPSEASEKDPHIAG